MSVQLPVSTSPQRARLTARDFWVLADSGAFSDFAKSELIEGELFVVNSVHSRHARIHAMLTIEIGIALKAMKSSLIPLAAPSVDLSDDSVPEPDIAIARRAEGKGTPVDQVVLAVEISDSSLKMDLGRKQRLYARAGIPEYWVANVAKGTLRQHWEPGADGYAQTRDISFGERIEAVTIPGLVFDTVSI